MTKPSARKQRLAGLRTAVYRFHDAANQLLYLGITHDIDERWATHQRTQPWWLDVSRREVTWYDTRAEAEQVEATATAAEKPRYDRSGQRTTGGEVDQRLEAETERAVTAIASDIDSGTYPLWRILPSYPALSEKYGIPMIGITRGLGALRNRDQNLVNHWDQYAVTRPGCTPSRDAQKVGLLYFLASNAFGDTSFTLADLAEVTGASPGTVHQHMRRWQKAGRAESVGKVRRAFVYKVTRHPEPDPPRVLTLWGRDDVRALTQWLNEQLDADPESDDRDRAIVHACRPDEYEYGVSRASVRVLKVLAQRYRERPGCLPEWGITEGSVS